ncbi:transglycosylase SLT domain-containing protein [Streptococcus pseudoporcinus]|uniref:Transglycosylase protein n=1 Tax=Streptococcus pseudoporcinus TaxID=361101 RepID=A0A4U9YK25_9STRE|nr:transglycosylase SLT domain-containing protein [Streptococcus pseudoporcinus]VTS26995.1 transglycosylase protein [Streptococcus pseudoporcinus]VUC71926.1 transglycosylase protein [Streptococcus pseudoporcinus]VUD01067.1 transglycosylase protein [Streptococcus pseudoporcinus]VUD01313.1 transglycosylase protein [Streptococcus pseudoporcinus]
MFKNENFKKRYVSFGVFAFAISLVALVFAFSSRSVDTESFVKKPETKVIKKESKLASRNTEVKKEKTSDSSSSSQSSSRSQSEAVTSESSATEPVAEVVETPAQEVSPVVQTQQATVQQYASPTSVYQANGNSAGVIGSQAAAQMAAATGVPQATWEAIIARESNGNPNASNPSGASGLFQTMPGWGSTATVQDQINAATRAYRAQGLSAWGY